MIYYSVFIQFCSKELFGFPFDVQYVFLPVNSHAADTVDFNQPCLLFQKKNVYTDH